MLTSVEDAYTDYLEHVVAGADVDPAIVRATLHQLGYSDATIAAMMGDAGASANFFADALDSSSTSTRSSVKTNCRPASRSSESPAPSEMSRPPAHDGVSGGEASPQAHRRAAAANAPLIQPPSIMHESKPISQAPTTSITTTTTTSPASSASSSSTSAAQIGERPSERCAPAQATCAAGNADGGDGDTSTVQRSSGRASASGTASSASCASSSEEGEGRPRVMAANQASLSSHASVDAAADTNFDKFFASLSAAEQAVLERWVGEYRALLLSSALPRRTPQTTATAAEKAVPLEKPFGECYPVPHGQASSVCSTETAAEDQPGAVLQGHSGKVPAYRTLYGDRGRPSPDHHHHRHPKQIFSEGCEASSISSSSGEFSGEATSATSSASTSPGQPRRGHTTGAKNKSVAVSPHTFCAAYITDKTSGWRRPALPHSPVVPPAPAFRSALPKAKSALFVPACASHGLTTTAKTCGRCAVAEAECRHPYREAQDARIVRAAQALVSEVGHHHTADSAASQSRGRELDVARETQRTSRAEPTTGRRVPVMHGPVRSTVCPRSGLECGRQTSTLPRSARTDRVSLAQYYRREWAKQERRTTVAARDATWDARYAMLSCSGAPLPPS